MHSPRPATLRLFLKPPAKEIISVNQSVCQSINQWGNQTQSMRWANPDDDEPRRRRNPWLFSKPPTRERVISARVTLTCSSQLVPIGHLQGTDTTKCQITGNSDKHSNISLPRHSEWLIQTRIRAQTCLLQGANLNQRTLCRCSVFEHSNLPSRGGFDLQHHHWIQSGHESLVKGTRGNSRVRGQIQGVRGKVWVT